MCSNEELARKIDALASDLTFIKTNMSMINTTVDVLEKYKNATVLKKMEEDIAVLDIMREMQMEIKNIKENIKDVQHKVDTVPCFTNPKLYDKFMKELSNEIIDTKGRIYLYMDREGKVRGINHYGCQFLGKPASQIIGKNWVDNFVPENERPRLKVVLDSLVSGKMNGYDTVINGVKTSVGNIEVTWKNFIFLEQGRKVAGIISLGIPKERIAFLL